MKILTRLTIFLLILTFGILYFTTITSLAGSGETISNLKKELTGLEKKNIEISIELNQKDSLEKIEEEAKKQGLIADTKIIYLAKKPSSLVVSKR